MNTTKMKTRPIKKETLLARYNCGPVQLSGDANAFYERHLTFDQLVRNTEATTRDKYEAIARSVRDVLSQRWLKTEETYPCTPPSCSWPSWPPPTRRPMSSSSVRSARSSSSAVASVMEPRRSRAG